MPGHYQNYSPKEWQTRCELAALYRLVAYLRMDDMIDTHITASVPGREQHFLINRYGVLFGEMRASDLVAVDSEGQVKEIDAADDDSQPDRYRVNAAGFTIHSAIHKARPDLTCIIHTHSIAGSAVSVQQHGLLPITQHALKFYESIGYHDYQGIALDLAEQARLVSDLGPHNAMILRNHGLLIGGISIAAAFQDLYFLERACEIQLRALAGGVTPTLPSTDVCRLAASQFKRVESAEIRRLHWEAALRLIDNSVHDYRT